MSGTEQKMKTARVQQCLDVGGGDCGAWEAEIDTRVAALYGL